MDSRLRTVIKSLTYRVLGTAITTSLTWAITGRADLAATIGLGDTLVKILAFYGHERLWMHVRLGLEPARARAAGLDPREAMIGHDRSHDSDPIPLRPPA